MDFRVPTICLTVFAMLILVSVSSITACAGSNAAGDSIKLNPITPSVLIGTEAFTISGNVTASSGSVAGSCTNIYNYSPNCGLLITVINPDNEGVAYARPAVNGSGARGTFRVTFIAGNNSDWIAGTYTAVASYDTSSDNTIPPAVDSAIFNYSAITSTTVSGIKTTTVVNNFSTTVTAVMNITIAATTTKILSTTVTESQSIWQTLTVTQSTGRKTVTITMTQS